MRTKPLPHPKIKLINLDWFVQVTRKGRPLNPTLSYAHLSFPFRGLLSLTKIEIAKLRDNSTEEEAIECVYHELDHWVQMMYLDRKELKIIIRAYTYFNSNNSCPLIERVNVYPQKSWTDLPKR